MATLESICNQTITYAATRRAALDLAGTMQAEIEAIQAKYDKPLQRAVTKMTEEHEALSQTIEDSPALFETSKSMTIDGIKIGYQVGKEKLKVADEAKAIDYLQHLSKTNFALENLLLASQINACIKTKFSLVDVGMKRLDTSILTNAGIMLVPATNDVLIKPQDDDSTKAIDNIIKTVLSELEA